MAWTWLCIRVICYYFRCGFRNLRLNLFLWWLSKFTLRTLFWGIIWLHVDMKSGPPYLDHSLDLFPTLTAGECPYWFSLKFVLLSFISCFILKPPPLRMSRLMSYRWMKRMDAKTRVVTQSKTYANLSCNNQHDQRGSNGKKLTDAKETDKSTVWKDRLFLLSSVIIRLALRTLIKDCNILVYSN